MPVHRKVAGKLIPVIITVYKDKSFDFILKISSCGNSVTGSAKLKSGSKECNRDKVGQFHGNRLKQLQKIKWRT